jgi:hypothetical protein
LQSQIPNHADIDFTSGDVLLGDRVRFGLPVNELDALGQLVIVVNDRGAGNAD